jgi:hypothetical protein
MAKTTKGLANVEGSQVLQGSVNLEDQSITTSGFLVGKIGRKITQTILTTTVPNDTTDLEFSENAAVLYTLRIIYTDGTRQTLLSAERVV